MFVSFDLSGVSFVIRSIVRSDLNDTYYSLLSQLSMMNMNQISEEKANEFYRNLSEYHKIFVIEDVANNTVIATGTIIIEQKIIHDYGSVGHIEDMVVNTNYQKYNLGKLLVEYLTDYCLFTMKCYKCNLSCSEYNKDFYIKCGYQCHGPHISLYKE